MPPVPDCSDLNVAECQAGYEVMRERLDRNLATARNRMPAEMDVLQAAGTERRLIHDLAIEASRDVRDNCGDRERGTERLDHLDFERGQRKALMDWSHGHNHRLLDAIQVLTQLQRSNEELPQQAQELSL